MRDPDVVMRPEFVKGLAEQLEPDTLDKIRQGIPVSQLQAMAAIAWDSQRSKPKKSWLKRHEAQLLGIMLGLAVGSALLAAFLMGY